MYGDAGNVVCQPQRAIGKILKLLSLLLTLGLALVVASPGYTNDGAIVDSIAQRLSVQKKLSGNFEQTKKLSFLTLPLVSSGRFSLDSTTGLKWVVEQPLQSHMSVRGGTVMLDGESVRDGGVAQFLAKIMQSFMDKDFSSMKREFSVSGEMVEDQQWHLELVPKSIMLRRAVNRIELKGGEFLESIVIYEKSDTDTSIVFTGVKGSDEERDAAHR